MTAKIRIQIRFISKICLNDYISKTDLPTFIGL